MTVSRKMVEALVGVCRKQGARIRIYGRISERLLESSLKWRFNSSLRFNRFSRPVNEKYCKSSMKIYTIMIVE